MTRWLVPLSVFLAALAAGGWMTLNAIPGIIMDRAMARIAGAGGADGEVRHAPRLTATNQTIVRASPDMLYSVCAYDLASGPRLVTAPWPADGNYASVSFYDARTNNFAVFSDRDSESPSTRLLLLYAPEADPVAQAGETLVSPTRRGLVLYRRVIDAGTDLAAAETERRGFTCRSLTDG
jgi:uncharacterized membrane protein